MTKNKLTPEIKKLIFEMLSAGQQLSNVAYNWKQDDKRPEYDRGVLDSVQKQWDEAASKVPSWVYRK